MGNSFLVCGSRARLPYCCSKGHCRTTLAVVNRKRFARGTCTLPRPGNGHCDRLGGLGAWSRCLHPSGGGGDAGKVSKLWRLCPPELLSSCPCGQQQCSLFGPTPAKSSLVSQKMGYIPVFWDTCLLWSEGKSSHRKLSLSAPKVHWTSYFWHLECLRGAEFDVLRSLELVKNI